MSELNKVVKEFIEPRDLLLFSYLADVHSANRVSKACLIAEKLYRKGAHVDGGFEMEAFVQLAERELHRSLAAAVKPGLAKIDPNTPVDLGAWIEFVREADSDEVFAVIMIFILKLPVERVARALQVTDGTIRYRVARGLKNFGAIPIPMNKQV